MRSSDLKGDGGKTVDELIVEMSRLIDEIRGRASRSRSEDAYRRYAGMLVPLYGTLLKALDSLDVKDEDEEEIKRAMEALSPRGANRDGEAMSSGAR